MVQALSYVIEAGSSPGAANLAAFDNGPATSFATGACRPACITSVFALWPRAVRQVPPRTKLPLRYRPRPSGNPSVTLTLVYTCNPCTGDPDNYALNVDCINGRCTVFRTSNATRSGTIRATVRMAPGVHNVEVVSRLASFMLTVTASPPGSGGMIPGSWRILVPPGGQRIVAWSL